MYIKFKWTPSMSVNDTTIDEQHKRLLNQLNVLLRVVFERKNKEIIREAVAFLSEYIESHLRYEEDYLAEHSYPRLQEHKEAHHYFETKYEEFKVKLEEEGPTDKILLEIESFLGTWWIEHIGHEDKKYADLFKHENSTT